MLVRLAFLTLLVGGCAATAPPLAPGKPAVQTIPPIELLTLDGRPTHLGTELAGRVALVSLWATWCDACSEEFEALARLEARARARGGVVVAIAVGEPRQRVADFLGPRPPAWPQLVDEQFHFADALGQKRVPATLILDRAGHILYTGGALDPPALTALDSALGPSLARGTVLAN